MHCLVPLKYGLSMDIYMFDELGACCSKLPARISHLLLGLFQAGMRVASVVVAQFNISFFVCENCVVFIYYLASKWTLQMRWVRSDKYYCLWER